MQIENYVMRKLDYMESFYTDIMFGAVETE